MSMGFASGVMLLVSFNNLFLEPEQYEVAGWYRGLRDKAGRDV
jgi:hypothetical protein